MRMELFQEKHDMMMNRRVSKSRINVICNIDLFLTTMHSIIYHTDRQIHRYCPLEAIRSVPITRARLTLSQLRFVKTKTKIIQKTTAETRVNVYKKHGLNSVFVDRHFDNNRYPTEKLDEKNVEKNGPQRNVRVIS